MRKAAARKLKEETDEKMAERRKIIEQRVGKPKKIEGLSESNFNYSLFGKLKLNWDARTNII